MAEISGLAFQYDVAEGPNGLRELLDSYLARAQNDPEFGHVGRYILYMLGDQRSLIRVDASGMPFHFRYCDLLGRPATRAVKETIAKFLWEKCGESMKYQEEVKSRHLNEAQAIAIYSGQLLNFDSDKELP